MQCDQITAKEPPMKCPKCGYNSFEFYDICKKCSGDLSGYKQTYGITPIVLPLEIREKMAEEFRAASVAAGQLTESIETQEDMFAFDLPEDTASSTATSTATASASFNDDPFNFDDEPPAAAQKQSIVDADPFADLLESTPQVSDDPFGAPPAPAARTAEATIAPGEFDLENFSWDDTPETSTVGGEKDTVDDFDSLFGDTSEDTKK
jgi:hypothetical protein